MLSIFCLFASATTPLSGSHRSRQSGAKKLAPTRDFVRLAPLSIYRDGYDGDSTDIAIVGDDLVTFSLLGSLSTRAGKTRCATHRIAGAEHHFATEPPAHSVAT